MDTQPLRFGIIGVGNMGKTHARNFKEGKSAGAVLTAICDTNKEKLKTIATEVGVKAFTRYTDLLDSGLVDAVIVATPHYWHPAMTIAAARRGIHVLCEKPIAVTIGPAKMMIEECRKANVKLGLMFMLRMRPATAKMMEIVRSGVLGDIFRVSMVGSSWYRAQSYYNSGGWRGTWLGEGGGILMNQGPHSLDLYQYVAGLPKTVTANVQTRTHQIEVENTANAILDYGGGKMGYIYATTAEAPGVEEMYISGSKASLISRDGKLRLGKLVMPLEEHIRTAENGFEAPKTEWEDVVIEGEDTAHPGVIAQFVKAVRENAPLIADGQDGLNQLTVCNAIYLAGFTGKTVSLPLDDQAMERLVTKLARTRGKPGCENLRRPAMRDLKKLMADA